MSYREGTLSKAIQPGVDLILAMASCAALSAAVSCPLRAERWRPFDSSQSYFPTRKGQSVILFRNIGKNGPHGKVLVTRNVILALEKANEQSSDVSLCPREG